MKSYIYYPHSERNRAMWDTSHISSDLGMKMKPRPRPRNTQKFSASCDKIKNEAVEDTELGDMEVDAGSVWFGVAEIEEIFEDAVGTYISVEEVPEDGGQSEWSLADCQELLGEEISEKIRINKSACPCIALYQPMHGQGVGVLRRELCLGKATDL